MDECLISTLRFYIINEKSIEKYTNNSSYLFIAFYYDQNILTHSHKRQNAHTHGLPFVWPIGGIASKLLGQVEATEELLQKMIPHLLKVNSGTLKNNRHVNNI